MENEIVIYLSKDGNFIISKDNEQTFDEENISNIGSTLEDIENGMIVKLNNEQISFLNNHPNLSYDKIFNMVESTIEERIESVRKIREELYKKESDPIYMAYIKYKEFGEEEKALAEYKRWSDKINEIDINNPYPTV